MTKYLKVMFGNTSGANKNIKYNVDEINISNDWNPEETDPKKMGGFNFSTEDKILRWLVRGDTIYDVTIPEDAEVIECQSKSAPHGVFRTNKIIISNPQPMTDDMALSFYKKSKLPQKSYYKALAGCAIRGYKNTCIKIIKDKINNKNIKTVLEEWNDFYTPESTNNDNSVYNEIHDYLLEIESNILISRFIDKKPYIKQISNDNIINLTGESGSGKSFYTKQYMNDKYIIIDTDILFSDKETRLKYYIDLRNIFKDKPKDYLITNFDDFYQNIIEYFKDTDKTIVIDSAQYRNFKNYKLLRGKIIVMRTSVENCYARVLERWKERQGENYSEEEYQQYATRKANMFKWYKGINEFIIKLNEE